MARLVCGFFLVLLNIVLLPVRGAPECSLGAPADTLFIDRSALRKQLVNEFNKPRDHTDIAQKERVRDYINTFFKNIRPSWDPRSKVEVTSFMGNGHIHGDHGGQNYIYTLAGDDWETPEDFPIVIGAHYDTVVGKPGVNDNGSGMAALLEIAKTITNADCKRLNTIYFVAFDYEETGRVGSAVFVREKLRPYLKRPDKLRKFFKGAFILDTLMNYNSSANSQRLPDALKQYMPEVAKEVESDELRGNFLALISRQTDSEIANMFKDQYNAVPDPTHSDNKYKIHNLIAPFDGRPSVVLNEEKKAALGDLLRSDHELFWEYDGTHKGLSAVFLTDTADFRGYMKQCYHKACDNVAQAVTDENIDFLAKTATALTNTVLQLATGGDTCAILDPWRTSSASGFPEYSLMMIMISLCAVSGVTRIL